MPANHGYSRTGMATAAEAPATRGTTPRGHDTGAVCTLATVCRQTSSPVSRRRRRSMIRMPRSANAAKRPNSRTCARTPFTIRCAPAHMKNAARTGWAHEAQDAWVPRLEGRVARAPEGERMGPEGAGRQVSRPHSSPPASAGARPVARTRAGRRVRGPRSRRARRAWRGTGPNRRSRTPPAPAAPPATGERVGAPGPSAGRSAPRESR